MSEEPRLSIQAVAQRTGLSPHVIRVWERRYAAVAPARTSTRQRRYSEAEVRRLNLLRRAIRAGHSIGTIAQLSAKQLEHLATAEGATKTTPLEAALDPAAELREPGIQAVKELDGAAFDGCLRRALVSLGHQGFLRRVIAPMAEEVGELWRRGDISAAHEHFFTAAVKMFFGDLAKQLALASTAPALIACTPAGQLHELGAFMAAISAMHLGWRALYLGASLPAADIAGAAIQHCAAVVVLSVVYPEDDPNLPAELRALRGFLPVGIRIIAGGRVARSYRAVLDEIGATTVSSLEQFSDEIDAVRLSASMATPRRRSS